MRSSESDEDPSKTLWAWYSGAARQVLARCCPATDLECFDRSWSELDAARSKMERGLEVGFIGNAGVGKSTLINTLVADQVTLLPQGGVGPLTAQATLVRHSPEPFFRVTYHERIRVLQLLWGLEQGRAGGESTAPVDLDARAIAEVESLIAEDRGRGVFPDAWFRQAAQLVQGKQYGEATEGYLLDGLRSAVRLASRWGARINPKDEQRLARIRAVLELAAAGATAERWGSSGELRDFLGELELHAADSLAPLVRTLQVGWDAATLPPGLVLVDLPGLGVANDESQRVTEEWLSRLQTLVLVVDRSGLSESAAVWLRNSRFLVRLVGHGRLLLVPVKLDLSADDARRTERQLGPGPFRTWREHYQEATRAAGQLMMGQLSEEWRQQRRDPEAWASVCDRILVQPVCAREYLLIRQADPEQPARLRETADSGIPPLREALAGLARAHADRLQAEHLAAEARLRGALKNWLESPASRTGRHRFETLRLREVLESLEKRKDRTRPGRLA